MTFTSLTRRPSLLAFLAFVLFGLGTPAFADSHKHSPQHQPQKNEGSMDPAAMDAQHGRMADELHLNDKQRELYRSAMHQKMEGMQNGMQKQEQLRELIQSDSYDEKKVREMIRNNQKEEEERIVKSSKAMNEFYKSLSPEQKTRMKELHKNKSEQMKAHMRDRMADHGKTKGHDKHDHDSDDDADK